MTPQEVLTKAAELLEANPTAWTQKWLARNAEGNNTSPRNPNACSWCALGAIAKVQNLPDAPQLYNPAAKLLASYLGISIVDWNDNPVRTRGEVAHALRSAAKSVTSQSAKNP
jgi:hypothetical protein